MKKLILALILLSSPVLADEICQDVVKKYNRVKGDLGEVVRVYWACVDSSRGRDDCSLEFVNLQSLQDDFERVVRDHNLACP